MTRYSLIVTIEDTRSDDLGVGVDDLATVLDGIRNAVRLMVMHLGGREPGPGSPPRWVRDESTLRIASTRPGSLVMEVTIAQPSGKQMTLYGYGQQAIGALSEWDGEEDSNLPKSVTDCLFGMAKSLPTESSIWFGVPDNRRVLQIPRQETTYSAVEDIEVIDTLLRGWLNEVNWRKRTAQLHDFEGGYVKLTFDADFDLEMLRLATQFIEVRGRGHLDRNGEFSEVEVRQLEGTRSWSEPFDLDAMLRDSDPRAFDPRAIPRVDLTKEEWESFNAAILEGRAG